MEKIGNRLSHQGQHQINFMYCSRDLLAGKNKKNKLTGDLRIEKIKMGFYQITESAVDSKRV